MMRVLELLSLGCVVLYSFVFFWIIRTILPLRKRRPVRIAAYGVFHFIANAIIYSNDLECLALTFLAFFLYLLVFHKGVFIEKISVFLVFYPALISVNYLMMDIGSRIFYGITQTTYAEVIRSPELMLLSQGIFTLSVFMRLLFWAGAWLVLRKFLYRITAHLTLRMWLIVDALILASFVAVFTIIFFMPEETAIVYPICGASIFSSFGCIYLASYICDATRNAYRVQALERQSRYYKDKIQDEERVRRIYHDLKNHLIVLQAETQGGQAAMQSIQRLREQVEGYENYYQTGNEVLDMILRDKAKQAQESRIDFSAALSFQDGGFIEPLDISTIFGNALDNAIEASEKLPEEQRLITLKTGRLRDMLFIVVENNAFSSGAASAEMPEGTTKQDAFMHGFGLSNIRKAVERYEGQCIVKAEAGVFTLKIVIPIP